MYVSDTSLCCFCERTLALSEPRLFPVFPNSLTQIPKFALVLVVVLRPRCACVFCSEKSPIVPQLFCSVILIVKHPDFRGRGRRRAREGVSNFGFWVKQRGKSEARLNSSI